MKIKRFTAWLLLIITCSFFTGCQCKHEFGNWETVKEPGYFETGAERRKCIACGEYETRTIPEKDHSELGASLSTDEIKKKANSKMTEIADDWVKSHSTRTLSYERPFCWPDRVDSYTGAYGKAFYSIDYDPHKDDLSGIKCYDYEISVYRWENNPDQYPEIIVHSSRNSSREQTWNTVSRYVRYELGYD